MGKGGIIGKSNEPSTAIASGMWSLHEQYGAKKASTWPITVIPLTFYSSATYGTPSTNLNTISWTHNVEPNASCLIAYVAGDTAAGMAGAVNTVTANGIAMTLIDFLDSVYVYRLFNPPTGIVTIESIFTGITIDRIHTGHSATFAGTSTVNTFGQATTGNQITTLNLTTSASSLFLITNFIQREGTTGAFTASLTAPTPNYTLQSSGVGVGVYRLTNMWTTNVIAASNTAVTVTASLVDTSIATNIIVAIALAT